MSPYGIATLINSVTRMLTNIADRKARRERIYGKPTKQDSTTQAVINTGLGIIATGGAVLAAVSDDDNVQSVGLYTAIVSGTILTATNAANIF